MGGSENAQDREIVRLAVPALGALAAEPLYILVDMAARLVRCGVRFVRGHWLATRAAAGAPAHV